MKSILLILGLFIFLFPVYACALGPKIEKHTAVWDPNTESDLAGYYLYWRLPTDVFKDAQRIDVGNIVSFDLLGLNLALPGEYFIAVSAYDTELNESGLSDEVKWDATYPDMIKNIRIE